jgi:dephospho-CoA kinase
MILVRNLLKAVFFGSSDIVMADVPLLFESGKLSWLFGVTICVTTDPHVQLQRLIKRNPELSKEECQARIDSQMSLEKKIQKADIVIDNTGNLEALNDQVEEVRKDLMGRLYGIGMSLLQMLLLIGGSTSIAVSSKFYTHWQ